jgi:hypothetical protein
MYEFAVAPAVTSIRRRGVEIAEVSPESLGLNWNSSRATELLRLMAAGPRLPRLPLSNGRGD